MYKPCKNIYSVQLVIWIYVNLVILDKLAKFILGKIRILIVPSFWFFEPERNSTDYFMNY